MKHRNTCAKFLNEINSKSFQAGFFAVCPPGKTFSIDVLTQPDDFVAGDLLFFAPTAFSQYRFDVFSSDKGIRFAAFINCPIQRRQSTPR